MSEQSPNHPPSLARPSGPDTDSDLSRTSLPPGARPRVGRHSELEQTLEITRDSIPLLLFSDEISRQMMAERIIPQGSQAWPHLVHGVNGWESAAVRANCARALGLIWEHSQENSGVVERPVRGSRRAQAAVGALESAIRSNSDHEILVPCLIALERFGKHAGGAAGSVADLMARSGDDARIRTLCRMALAEMGEPGVRMLTGLLSEGTRNTRLEAAFGLKVLGPQAASAVGALREGLQDRYIDVRVECAAALGKIGVPAKAALSELVLLCGHRNGELREAASRAVESIRG